MCGGGERGWEGRLIITHREKMNTTSKRNACPKRRRWDTSGGWVGDWGLGCYHTEIIKIAGSIGY